jgi:lipoprotein-releasing system permease protein
MIGILKSIGAENASVRKIFLYNAMFLTAKGLLWGNVIGIAICLLQHYTGLFPLDTASYYVDTVPINLNISSILLLNIGTLLVTTIMMVIPSFVITKISPIKAIQFD